MDGRDFGPPRSVHGPPPLLSGLAMESHRLGATGRLAPAAGPMAAGLPAALQPGKFLASGISLHSHPGKAPRNPRYPRAFPPSPPRSRAADPGSGFNPPPPQNINIVIIIIYLCARSFFVSFPQVFSASCGFDLAKKK